MSCALFVCFEAFQGKCESVPTHMESEVRMYHNWQAENGNSGPHTSSGSCHIVDKEIAQIFSRLHLQVLMFPDTHLLGKDFYTTNVNPLIDPPPKSFSCLKKARDRLDNCTICFRMCDHRLFSRQDFVDHTQKLSQEYQTYHTLLSQWPFHCHLYDELWSRPGARKPPET